MSLTIEEMLAQVGDGESKTFEASPAPGHAPDGRYLEIQPSHKYPFHIMAEPSGPENRPAPQPALYNRNHVPLSQLHDAPVLFHGYDNQLVDLYQWSLLYLLSDRLHAFLTQLDPGCIESRRMTVHIRGDRKDTTYWAAIPARVLRAVDIQSTRITIKSMSSGAHFVKVVNLEGGCRFDPAVTRETPTFIDVHQRRWLWSKDVFPKAQAAGFRGLRGIAPSDMNAYNAFDF